VPAVVEFVDIAGLVKGASQGEGLGNKFLANIRETDAIAHVVRCFEDDNVVHVTGSIDPVRARSAATASAGWMGPRTAPGSPWMPSPIASRVPQYAAKAVSNSRTCGPFVKALESMSSAISSTISNFRPR
jgi:hypothetical protein